MGERYYLPAASQRGLGVPVRFSGGCTKHAVGWQVRANMPEALFTSALQRVLLAQRPAPSLVVHSDRGRTW